MVQLGGRINDRLRDRGIPASPSGPWPTEPESASPNDDDTKPAPATLDVLRALALALNVSADSLIFDLDERGPKNPTLRLKLEAVDKFTPDVQEHVAAFIEGSLHCHHARQTFSDQAS